MRKTIKHAESGSH